MSVPMPSNNSPERRKQRRAEAEERNAKANAKIRACGCVHGEGVGCNGREGIDLTRVQS